MAAGKGLVRLDHAVGGDEQPDRRALRQFQEGLASRGLLLFQSELDDEVRFDEDIHAATSATTRPFSTASNSPVSTSAPTSSGAVGCQRCCERSFNQAPTRSSNVRPDS